MTLILLGQTSLAYASNLPMAKPLKELANGIGGDILLAISTIMMVASFVMLAFGEWGDGMKRLINIVFWLAGAFFVPSLIAVLFK